MSPVVTDQKVNDGWERYKTTCLISPFPVADCIQRMRRSPPLDELQPPPYQDENGSPRMSCTLSDVGDAKCDLSHTSGSPHLSFSKCPSQGSDDHESYFNKGYEEDVPSDSTAVLSPEVNMSDRWGRSQPDAQHLLFFRMCQLVDQQLSSPKVIKQIQ